MGLLPASIEEVKVGEKVLSRNERSGPTSYAPVLELIQHDGTFQLVKVTLDSGESLGASAGHPFYVQGKGWNVAANLKVGDALQLHNGITLVIKTVETSTYVGRVYNFAVAQNANYFIGEDGVLVHNSACNKWSKEKEALVDMAKKERREIAKEDMQAYKDLNKELPDTFPDHKVRGTEKHPNSKYPHARVLHGHVGPVDHIPIKE